MKYEFPYKLDKWLAENMSYFHFQSSHNIGKHWPQFLNHYSNESTSTSWFWWIIWEVVPMCQILLLPQIFTENMILILFSRLNIICFVFFVIYVSTLGQNLSGCETKRDCASCLQQQGCLWCLQPKLVSFSYSYKNCNHCVFKFVVFLPFVGIKIFFDDWIFQKFRFR